MELLLLHLPSRVSAGPCARAVGAARRERGRAERAVWGAEPRGPGGACEGNARPPELLAAAAGRSGLAGRGQGEGPGASSGWRRGRLAQRELRRSGAPGPGGGRAAPAVGGGQGDGGPGLCNAGVPEPALEVLSPAGVTREVEESIRLLARTWRTGVGVSLLWGLEVPKKIGKGAGLEECCSSQGATISAEMAL